MAQAARCDWRYARFLREKLAWGIRELDSLLPYEQRLLRDLESGQLERRRNDTTLEHGFGSFYDADGLDMHLGVTPSLASQLLSEQRYAANHMPYTYADFVQYYGKDHGPRHWMDAPVAPPATFD